MIIDIIYDNLGFHKSSLIYDNLSSNNPKILKVQATEKYFPNFQMENKVIQIGLTWRESQFSCILGHMNPVRDIYDFHICVDQPEDKGLSNFS